MPVKPTNKPTTLLQQAYQKFWQGFNLVSAEDEEFCKAFTVHPFPSIRSYQDYAIGKPYQISVGVKFNRHEIQVAAYFNVIDVYRFYSKFKEQIERNAGKNLMWKCYQIKARATLYDTAYFDENHGWDGTYQIMMADMILMKKAFECVPPLLNND